MVSILSAYEYFSQISIPSNTDTTPQLVLNSLGFKVDKKPSFNPVDVIKGIKAIITIIYFDRKCACMIFVSL
jgi:hypothetical protein